MCVCVCVCVCRRFPKTPSRLQARERAREKARERARESQRQQAGEAPEQHQPMTVTTVMMAAVLITPLSLSTRGVDINGSRDGTVMHCHALSAPALGGAHFAVCGMRISWGACSAHLKRFFNVHSRAAALELWSAAVRIEKALQMRTERAPGKCACHILRCVHTPQNVACAIFLGRMLCAFEALFQRAPQRSRAPAREPCGAH